MKYFLNNWISILGAVTGLASLSWNIFTFYKRREKLTFSNDAKIYIYDYPVESYNGFFNPEDEDTTELVVNMMIHNPIDTVVTITKVTLFDDYKEHNVLTYIPPVITFDDRYNESIEIGKNDSLDCPVRIDEKSSIKVSLRFIFPFKHPLKEQKQLYLKFYTQSKEFKFVLNKNKFINADVLTYEERQYF